MWTVTPVPVAAAAPSVTTTTIDPMDPTEPPVAAEAPPPPARRSTRFSMPESTDPHLNIGLGAKGFQELINALSALPSQQIEP